MGTAFPANSGGGSSAPGFPAFRLGVVEVHPESGLITGPGGTRQLDPKVMDVLLQLAENPGEVVSRESLMEAVWPGVVVTEFALSRCIYQLRKNLARAAGTREQAIETLPKRGYRLAWTVSEAERADPGRLARVWPRLGLALALLTVIGAVGWFTHAPPSGKPHRIAVAVLPFADLTPRADMTWFGDGVATSLMTELGRLSEIDVIARTSSFLFRDQSAPVDEIGSALDVDYVVEGSVNQEGEAIQVTATLVDAANGRQVWSDTFAGIAGETFSAQQDIAGQIAAYLELSVGDPRKHGGTSSLEAYRAFLQANYAMNQTNDLDLADIYLDQALAIDPGFADALEAKAFLIYYRLWQGDGAPEQAWSRARPLLERVLATTGGSEWAYATTAGFQMFLDDYASAEASLEQALTINPSHAWTLVHLSRLMERTGRHDEAVKLAERNVRLDPLNPFRHIQLANRRWSAGDIEGGKADFEHALELDPLNYAGWHDFCLRLANAEGELAGFRLLARLQKNPEFRAQFLGPTPSLAPSGVELVALWLGFIGDFDRQAEMLDLQSRLGENSNLHRELGWSLLARGDLDGARREAWKAIEGMPREDIANSLIAAVVLRSGTGAERALGHYREFWPELFGDPPSAQGVPDRVVASAALVLQASGKLARGSELLEALVRDTDRSGDMRAIALAHLGRPHAALNELQRHIDAGGYFGYFPGNPFWTPLLGQSRFSAMVDAESRRDAQVRREVNAMIASGDLVLPGQTGS